MIDPRTYHGATSPVAQCTQTDTAKHSKAMCTCSYSQTTVEHIGLRCSAAAGAPHQHHTSLSMSCAAPEPGKLRTQMGTNRCESAHRCGNRAAKLLLLPLRTDARMQVHTCSHRWEECQRCRWNKDTRRKQCGWPPRSVATNSKDRYKRLAGQPAQGSEAKQSTMTMPLSVQSCADKSSNPIHMPAAAYYLQTP